ncbi:ACt domain-containing protein [Fadolivirus algeromassiliense]|jgi:hypothetical protein|uniref:ACt domain-containing protein n=1 Tax=Fadolivirus FV1/VV64 TaxID=3070911 RepID=A0A7D3UTR3_9VIRU|nr:ACt domain-containing protein [Fadolivirus algeromassiliense]QKF94490.1 ACt domain-containing protein [Fadolivirus FV1/VV64]
MDPLETITINTITWQRHTNEVNVYGFNELNPSIILKLTKLLLNNSTNNTIFSITKSLDEITVIIDEEYDLFDDEYHIYKERYICYILLNTGSFVEESGLLKKISTFFAQYDIPILYITTVNNNYLFIPKCYEEKADALVRFSIRL